MNRIRRLWDSLDWYEQILVVGALWAILWVALIIAIRPYLLEAVA